MPKENSATIAEKYLHELRTAAAPLSTQTITHWAQQAVALFFAHHKTYGEPLRPAIELLCEINALPNPELSRIGLEALFPQLIERLNDAFEMSYCELYDRLFAQVISFFRRLPEGRDLDSALTRFGLLNETSIFARKIALTERRDKLTANRPLKKILFLSRVTIGADVAITSVMMARLKQRYPQAELVLIGPKKLTELYANDPRIRVVPINYGRRDRLLSRLQSWSEVVTAVEVEVARLSPSEFSIFDPDSRLTQLGLLPLLQPEAEGSSYYFFESRRFARPGLEKLGQLTSQWLNELCGDSHDSYPFISLSSLHRSMGIAIKKHLCPLDNQRIICLSFGVGGNWLKRVSESFEIALVEHLIRENKLLLDFGFTDEEHERTERLLAALQAQGITVLRMCEANYPFASLKDEKAIDIIAWQGGIGSFAALIAASDQYIGYDSSGQHLAAALEIPTLTIFVNSGSLTFAQRWQPYGKNILKVLLLESSELHFNQQELNKLLQKVSHPLSLLSLA